MPEKMPAPRRLTWEQDEKLQEQAYEKARDVNFTTRDNPLAYVTPDQAYAKQRIASNMDALREDARRRKDPANGRVYGAIMDLRHGG